MKLIYKSFFIACLIELPFFVTFYYFDTQAEAANSISSTLIHYFHVVPIAVVGSIWFYCFGHGSPTFGPKWGWDLIFMGSIFVGQAIVLASLIFLALSIRNKRSGDTRFRND